MKTKGESLQQASKWNLQQDGIKKTFLQYLPIFDHQENIPQLKKSEQY